MNPPRRNLTCTLREVCGGATGRRLGRRDRIERQMKLLLLWGVLALTGCVTEMGAKGIERLTTCEKTDWAGVQQALLRNGYELKKTSDTELETEFKNTDDYGADRKLRKFTVTKGKDGTIRFKERLKSVRRDDSMITGGIGSGGRRSGVAIGIQVGDPMEIQTEFDQEYYEEHRDEYESAQQEVCG